MYAVLPEGGFLTLVAKEAPEEALAILDKAHRACRALRALPDDGRYWLPPGQMVEVLKKIAVGARFTFASKPLILNLFSPVPFQEGHLLIRNVTLDPSECDALGRGWCIYRGALRLLSEQIRSPETPQPVAVWPVLQLTDQRGAFANLIEGKEEWEADLLETDFIKKRVDGSTYYCPMDKVAKALTFLLEVGWTVVDSQGRQVHRQTALETKVTADKQWLHINGRARYEDHEVDLAQVVGAFNRRESFVEIGSNRVGLLPDSSPIAELPNAECVHGALRFPKCRIGQLEPFLDSADPGLRSPLEVGQPERFVGTLRPYQQVGLNWLAYVYEQGFSGFLADDMGLGKTVQVIAFLACLDPQVNHLIVAPTSLIFNWRRELNRFLPDQLVTVHHGSGRDPSNLSGVVLTSYGTLRSDAELLGAHSFCCVILDEAQAIKNPDSQIAQVARQIPATFRLCISGTPVENRLEELWSHFHFLMPELLGDRLGFSAKVASASNDPRYARSISQAVRPFILRRTKEEVATDLPDKIEQTVELTMDADQRVVYEELLSGSYQVAQTGSRMEVLTRILRLRQVCCHPLLVGYEGTSSAKLEALISELDTLVAEGRKVLVFSQFSSMLHLIGRHLEYPHLLLTGETQHREALVERFQTDCAIQIFLVSLRAGGSGLNLTAADTVFLYDPWWNEAVENQAIDRAHRIGQAHTVVAKRYILADTIEGKLMRLKAHKRSLGNQLLDDTALTDATLRALLTNE